MDSDPIAHDESQDEQQLAETVALNYIDKVHASLTKQWDAMSRSLTAQTIVSVVTITICIEAVRPQEGVSLFGLGFNASISPLLVGSAFIIAAFHVVALSATVRAAKTSRTLRRLYKDIGSQEAAESGDTEENPFGAAVPLRTSQKAQNGLSCVSAPC
jgi:hypothetical protein